MGDGSTSQSSLRFCFPDWFRKLQADPSLTPGLRECYRLIILEFFAWCRRRQSAPKVVLARQYVEVARLERGPSPARLQEWKDGLNWLFRQGREAPATVIKGLPPLARSDQGKVEWERRLIARLRLKGFSWRTKQTYRGWVRRLALFLKPRSMDSADGGDMRRFLTHLAVEERVSGSTQKQALNALVFYLREVEGREPGDFSDFTRAGRRVRVPVVLSGPECRRLFEALEGTTLLMAELMFGSGVRLTELLRLRIKDVDLESRKLIYGWFLFFGINFIQREA